MGSASARAIEIDATSQYIHASWYLKPSGWRRVAAQGEKVLRLKIAVVVLCALVVGESPSMASGVYLADGIAKVRPIKATPRQERPNILIFLTDDQRYEGTMQMLPSVEEWFGRQGTEFTRSFVTTPLCCPSRASILTGRYAHNHRVLQNGTDAVDSLRFSQTLPAYLKRAGYRTALFGKYFNKWPKDRAPRFFDRYAVSGADYYGARFNVNGKLRTIGRYATDYISDRADRYVSRAAGGEPWFMYVAPVAVHAPYQPEADYVDAAIPQRAPDRSVDETDRSDKPAWVRNRPLSDPAEVDRKYKGQLRALISVDDMVERVMTTLKETGQADNTLAIFMSDNGFMWGEHGLGQKKYPYTPSIQVPLLLRWPGHIEADLDDDRLAANVDVMPTVLEAAGIAADDQLDGLSLLGSKERKALYLEFVSDFKKNLPHWTSILTSHHQYIEYRSQEGVHIYSELYDLIVDPSQMVNVLRDRDLDRGNHPAQHRRVRRSLEKLMGKGRSCRGRTCHFRIAPTGASLSWAQVRRLRL